ncbi:protein of unknown function [Hyphomicrobium sp. 1Nfss2.1]
MIRLPRTVLPPERATRREKLKVMKHRQRVLHNQALALLASAGVEIIEDAGAGRVFSIKRGGKVLRAAFKSAADRTLSVPKDRHGKFGLLDRVDVVFFASFDQWPNIPTRLSIYEIDSATVVEMAETVYALAAKRKETGYLYLPVDDQIHRPQWTTAAAGSLIAHATLVTDQPIGWDGREVEPDTQALTQERPLSPTLEIERRKADLAAVLGLPASAISITISL